MIDLIYCYDSRKFQEIAIECKWLYGVKLPGTVYFDDLYFSDQDWKKPDKERYINAVKEYRPHMATVLDLEKESQFDEVIEWAECIAPYVNILIIIPKVSGMIQKLPKRINSKEIRLGYSVPTSYAGTKVMFLEFCGWPIHLLGGHPTKQMELITYLDVKSADCNQHTIAAKWGKHWANKKYQDPIAQNAMYEMFRLSCTNIYNAWMKMSPERH